MFKRANWPRKCHRSGTLASMVARLNKEFETVPTLLLCASRSSPIASTCSASTTSERTERMGSADAVAKRGEYRPASNMRRAFRRQPQPRKSGKPKASLSGQLGPSAMSASCRLSPADSTDQRNTF